MTKLQALNHFCDFFNYTETQLVDETKVEFLARMQKQWALQIVERRVREVKQADAEVAKEQVFSTELAGLDL